MTDSVPNHDPTQLDALLTGAFQGAVIAKKVQLLPETAAEVLLLPSLGPGSAGKVRITWLLRSRLRPNVTSRTAFEFKSTNFGVSGVSAMVAPVLAQAVVVRADALREPQEPKPQGVVDASTPAASPDSAEEAAAAKWTSRRNAITVRPKLVFLLLPVNGTLLVGGVLPLQLRYERALLPNVSLFLAPEVLAPIPFLAFGFDLGAHYYPFGNALEGFNVGLSVAVDVITPSAFLPTSFGLITPTANLGYSAVWGTGITANVELHVGYMIATSSGAAIGGVALGLSAGVGYAF